MQLGDMIKVRRNGKIIQGMLLSHPNTFGRCRVRWTNGKEAMVPTRDIVIEPLQK